MKKIIKKLGILALTFLVLTLFATTAFAEEISLDDHDLILELPEEFTEINAENAEDNIDIIKSFGYEENSFKAYLEKEGIILFATDQNGVQINIKSWESDFSKKTEDLSYISNDALLSVRDKLIGRDYTGTKTADVNGMKFIEVTKNDKDSGGEFCTVQYLTVRNGKIYSLAISFPDSLTEAKTDFAWKLVCDLQIEDNISSSFWGVGDIILMIFIWLLIGVAIIAVGVILLSFISDAIKKRGRSDFGADYIERRK